MQEFFGVGAQITITCSSKASFVVDISERNTSITMYCQTNGLYSSMLNGMSETLPVCGRSRHKWLRS